ncbi:MAG TPA: efflux RND transporter periplasmic adaptor subunit [Phycisphaerales bacterium]|nr:efflux RND transporter periplasmic adaptor subunit [Phycisphaerales bacterium]
MKKALLILVVLLALGGGGWFYWNKTRDNDSAAEQPAMQTATVARGNIFQAVPSTGRVVSNLDVEIKARAGGQVVKLPFDISQEVKKGDLLLQLDPTEQQRTVSQREVSLTIVQARLAQAKQNLVIAEQEVVTSRDRANAALASAQVRAKEAADRAERRRQLLAENLGSQEDYDAAMTAAASAAAELENAKVQLQEIKTSELALEVRREDVKLAEAQVTDAQIALDLAKTLLGYTTVTAPIDGVVASLTTQTGAMIASATTNVGGGTSIMILSDLSRVFILAAVDESDIGQVEVGQDVDITLDAYPGKKFEGKVVRIATKGVSTNNVVTFEVKIEVEGPNKKLLKPEMTGNVQIIAAQKADVLTIPMAAVQRKERQQVVTVVNEDGSTTDVPVKVGLNDGEKYEVLEGLKEGQKIQYRAGDEMSRWRADQQNRPRGMGMPGMGFPGGGGRGGGGGRR